MTVTEQVACFSLKKSKTAVPCSVLDCSGELGRTYGVTMKVDLKRVDCADVEEFCDTLTDNAVIMTGLPPAGTEIEFGNGCALQVLAHEHGQAPRLTSTYFLNTQAERGIKITIVWEEEEPGLQNPGNYMPLEVYFEDTGTGPFDDGPNQDPRDSSNWEEWLTDFGVK